MKTKDFKKELRKLGYSFARSNKHETWSNNNIKISFPLGKEINKMLSRRLLKEAKGNKNEQQQNAQK